MATKVDGYWDVDLMDLLVEKRITRDNIFRSSQSHKTGWLLILSDLRKHGAPKTLNRVNIKKQWFKICETYKKLESTGQLRSDIEPYYNKLHKFFIESKRRQQIKNISKSNNKIGSTKFLNLSKNADRWSTERADLLIDRRVARNLMFNRRGTCNSAWQTVLSDLLILGEPKSLTTQQVKKKWDNLCYKYKKEKQIPASTWHHFTKMNDFYNNDTNPFINEDINKCFLSMPECYEESEHSGDVQKNSGRNREYSDRWTKERTFFLIERRKMRNSMFDGRGMSRSGWESILMDFQEANGPRDMTVHQIKKKWENLCTRYKLMKCTKPNSNWIYYKKLNEFFKQKSADKESVSGSIEHLNIKPSMDWTDDWPDDNSTNDKLSKCRLCQENNSDHSLTDNKELCSRITACTSIKVHEDKENLPKGICDTCKISLDKFHDFLVQCHTVDEELRERNPEIIIKKEADNVTSDLYECCECPASFTTIGSLETHLISHKKSSRFHCEICSTTFTRQSALYSHIKRHFETNNVPATEITSETDDYTIEDQIEDKNYANIVGSKIAHTKEIKNLIPCEVCSKLFDQETELQKHLDTHSRTIHECPREGCEKTYLTLTSLRNHERKHLGLQSFLCVICGKGFVTKNALKHHEKIHSDLKDYICDICSSGFSIMSNLKAHIRKHHEGHRFYCSQCPKEFLTKSSLQRHELVHTGIKDFICDTCSSAFYTNKELIKHKRYHDGVRLYHCKQCFKAFYEKHHLTIHIRTHTGERPYECKVPGCGKAFRESNKLARHVKVIHRIINESHMK